MVTLHHLYQASQTLIHCRNTLSSHKKPLRVCPQLGLHSIQPVSMSSVRPIMQLFSQTWVQHSQFWIWIFNRKCSAPFLHYTQVSCLTPSLRLHSGITAHVQLHDTKKNPDKVYSGQYHKMVLPPWEHSNPNGQQDRSTNISTFRTFPVPA
jgi:hypothetical protein